MEQRDFQKLEILAPVGGQEQLLAAVRSGADAVYLGLSAFNARRNAANFDAEALKRAVAYCHARRTRVHVTLNTLVLREEMPALYGAVRDIAAAGADAVIVQDLGVAQAVRRVCPSLPMHASTQMAVHNTDGVRALAELGFARAVLARELTLGEIERIAQRTALELEVFVHGALCMGMSGCCTLSCMLGGRSGNRGLCAQPCRLNFSNGERDYALSLKDLSAIGHMRALFDAGVCSLKIEGRMKRPEYVAAAVSACVAARAGEPYDTEQLRAVFSRSGFTDGYLTGVRTREMFGSRTREDVTAAAPVLKALAETYRSERPRVPVSMDFDPYARTLRAKSGAETACASAPADIAVQPVEAETARERARRSLQKTGGTPFYLDALTLTGASGSLPVSALNGMRREALEALLARLEVTEPHPVTDAAPTAPESHRTQAEAPALRLRFAAPEQIAGEAAAEKIILPVRRLTPALLDRFGDRLVAELPRALYPMEEAALQAQLTSLADAGLTAVLAENLYGVALGKRLGLRVHGGFGLNVTNADALCAYAAQGVCDMTLSFELPEPEVRGLGGTLPRGIVAYGELPLMYMRACPLRGAHGCGDCPGAGELTDRKGVRFPVRCERRQYSVLYNSVPLYLGDERLSGLDFVTLYFTAEPAARIERTVRAFRNGDALDVPRTRGLYRRELL